MQIKEYKRELRTKEQEQLKLESENSSLSELTKQLRGNSEHLMSDLVKQQRIAKDSLRALESLSDKYDREKRELNTRLEREKEDSIKRELQKFEQKVNSLKSINDQMGKKLLSFDDT